MDSCTSHLGYNTHQHPHSLGDEHVSQQNYPSGLGRPSVHVTNGLPVSHRSIDLFTRLIALEKDLQISQTENTKKEAVIQYLLYSKVSNAETEKLKEQNNNLEKEIARLNDDSERVKDKLGKALDTIFALSTPNVAGVVSQSISASCSSCCKPPSVEALKTEDLIDLLKSSEECASAVQTEEDTTLLDDIYDEVLDNKTTLEHSLHESLESPNLEFQAPPYIVHFADNDEEGKPNDSAKDVTSVRCLEV